MAPDEPATMIGIDLASGPDKTVIILHPCMKMWDPEYIAELEAMEGVELIWMDSVLSGRNDQAKEKTLDQA